MKLASFSAVTLIAEVARAWPTLQIAVVVSRRAEARQLCRQLRRYVPDALAVTSQQRSALLPDLPTLKEARVDVEANAWIGLIAPVKTPEPIVAAVSREVAEALRDPGRGEKLKALYMEPLGTSPAEFKAHVDAEMKRWTPVIKAREIKIN